MSRSKRFLKIMNNKDCSSSISSASAISTANINSASSSAVSSSSGDTEISFSEVSSLDSHYSHASASANASQNHYPKNKNFTKADTSVS